MVADDPSILMLSEIWYPGWKAYDNGKEVEILKANYIFRAVPLQKGEHIIEMVMDPLSFKVGLIVSFLTLTSLLAYFMLILSQKDRKLYF